MGKRTSFSFCANLIGTGLVRLLQEPGRWHTLCEHPEFIAQTIEEICAMMVP